MQSLLPPQVGKFREILEEEYSRKGREVSRKFEKWLQNHQDSTREEAHKRLIAGVKSAIMSSHLLMRAILWEE